MVHRSATSDSRVVPGGDPVELSNGETVDASKAIQLIVEAYAMACAASRAAGGRYLFRHHG
jgi:hypothetical protein